jgi:O-antigen/teichoic acid export membrane protein
MTDGDPRRVDRLRELLRTTPHDVDSAEGRGRERERRVALSSLAGGAARVLGTVSVLLLVPFVDDAIGSDGLGLWLLLVSAVNLVGFSDLGIGNGVLNAVARADGEGAPDQVREAISSGFFTLLGVAVGLGVMGFAIGSQVDWAGLLGVDDPALADQVGPAVAAFAICVLASLPFSIAQRVHIGLQESWLASGWIAVGAVASIVAVLAAIAADRGLTALVAAALGGPLLAGIGNSADLFLRRRPDLRPTVGAVTRRAAREITSSGALFFVLSVAIAVGYQADGVVISHYLGPAAVATYGVAFRFFMLAPTLLGFVVTPLWPAYREALTRGDVAWVRSTFKRSLQLGLIVTVPPSLLLIAMGPAVTGWVSDVAEPSTSLLLGLAAWAVVTGISGPLAMFLNGAHLIRWQAIAASVMAAANIALSIVLVQEVGIAGPVWASVATQIVCINAPALLLLRNFLAGRVDIPQLASRQGLVATNE